MILENDLFYKFVNLIWKKTGIYYEINKKYYVQKRLEKRVIELGMSDFKQYYQYVKFSIDQSELDKLINELTINETYFFRDFPQLQNFAEHVLPLLIKKKEKNNDFNLRIWSAACSTGEEPYTLAIILLEMLDNLDKWNIQILASDINTDVLDSAKLGIYESRSVKDVPEEYLYRYFTLKNNKYLVNLNIKKMVKFKQINLNNFKQTKNIIGWDFIFCRNCLIYFNDESRKHVIDNFYNSLNSGGFIFLGHSESIGRISSAFKVDRIGDTIVYSKP